MSLLNLTHPPSKVLIFYLQEEELVQFDSVTQEWFGTFGGMSTEADQAVSITDTTPMNDGSIMATGEYILHPGINVRIRSKDYDVGYNRAKAIQDKLATIKNVEVVMDEATNEKVKIKSFGLVGGVSYVGREEQEERHYFTLNGVLTF